jgi:hypothetical protein
LKTKRPLNWTLFTKARPLNQEELNFISDSGPRSAAVDGGSTLAAEQHYRGT